MTAYPGFCGGSGSMQSRTANDELLFNRYLEANDAGTPPTALSMYVRPALRRVAYCGAGPILGTLSQDGHCWVVSGASFGELLPSGEFVPIGSVDVGGIPATISSSGDQGDQLFITAGGNGWIYTLSTGAFAQIFDDGFPDYAVQGLFVKGAFACLGIDGRLHISANEDGTEWNALDSGFISDFSDRIIAIGRWHDRILMFGSKNMQPLVNQGTGGIAGWVPDGGTMVEHGIASGWSYNEFDNTATYLVRDEQGAAMVVRLNGYTPQRISNHAVEYDLRTVESLAGAVSTSFQFNGHTFYLLTVPGLKWSWLYDISTQQWVNWGHNDPRNGTSVPFRGMWHAFAFGKHLFGDRQSGAIYALDADAERDLL